ncbi:hypothetical protein DPMN_043161 [Dreissena polymorpha]|uniref:Uncharacterized protein n=3 Tax=Dreissena polymorpha TaxID=45954 RepID=A0A9D4D0U5_DREPO|nr:hypothetical protein DPMN_043161 [Dreissena polymorpha]
MTINNTIDQSTRSIFADLIDGEEEEISLQLASDTVYILKDSDMILQQNQQCHCVCVFEGSIIIAVETEGIVTMFLYQEINGLVKKNNFKTIVFGKIRYSSLETDSSFGIDEQAIQMYIVTTEHSRKLPNSVSSSVLCINNTLFQQLFGSEIALLRCPVLLICLPSGHVSYVALYQFERAEVGDSILSNTRTANSTCVGFCEMSFGVPFLLPIEYSNLTTTSEHGQQSSDHSPCLLVLDRSGSALLFTPDDTSTLPVMSKSMVDGPIKAVCSVADKVYVSTGRNLLEYSFNIMNGEEKAIVPALNITKVLEYRNVIHIIREVKEGFFTVSDAPPVLHLLMSNCEIQEITIESKNGVGCLRGESIGDYIKEMDEEALKTKRITSQRLLRTNVLHQLNVSAHMFSMNENDDNELNMGFHLTNVNCKNSSTGNAVTVSVTIRNATSVTLNREWLLRLSVLPLSSSGTEQPDFDVSSYVVPLSGGWRAEQSVTVEMTIDKSFAYQGFVLAGKLCLACDMSEDEISRGKLSSTSPTLSVPAFMEEINVLHFLINKDQYEEFLKTSECTEHSLHRINLYRCKTDSKYRVSSDTETVMTVLYKKNTGKLTGQLYSRIDELLLKDGKDVHLVTAFGDHIALSQTSKRDEDLKEVTIRGIHNAVIAVSNSLARCNQGPLIRDKKHVRKVLDILKDTRQLCDKARQSKTLESFNKTAEAFQRLRNVHI